MTTFLYYAVDVDGKSFVSTIVAKNVNEATRRFDDIYGDDIEIDLIVKTNRKDVEYE